jgi:hypothetical protein
VEILWRSCQPKTIFDDLPNGSSAPWNVRAASRQLSLERWRTTPTMATLVHASSPIPRALVRNITETIEGRTYHIEVSRIGADRWRAHLVRVPGVPAAMMPFYGSTPEHAAQRLAEWLAGAQRSAQG